MKKQTKIVATISDRRCDPEFIRSLYEAGMNVVRLNTAHQGFDDTLKVINNARSVSENIAFLLDTKGPEIRTTKVDDKFEVKTGDLINVKGAPDQTTSPEAICVSYEGFVTDVPVGAHILIDDGDIELKVVEKDAEKLVCEVQNTGFVKSRKSINVPGVAINLPALSPKDRDYIKFAIDNDIDFIAHSFVRDKEDLMEIQSILDAHYSPVKLIAKIENQQGVDNLDEILDHAYGVMVARGDLGIEIPAERIPAIQKMISRKCIARRRPVIVATQMLHTMIENPRPTRAEVSDVANAIFEGSDAVMLSGETAYGDYPHEAVTIMAKIASQVESTRRDLKKIPNNVINNEIAAYLSKSAVEAAARLNVKAIIADSMQGRTIRDLAAFRGRKPIYAMCYTPRLMRELSLSFGVKTFYMDPKKSTDEFLLTSLNMLTQNKVLDEKDVVVVIAGNFGTSNGASFIEIGTVRNLIKKY